jgi:predicted naringenin-chalcone synthase
VSVIAGVHGVVPANRYSQDEITDWFLAIPAFAGYEQVVRGLRHKRIAVPSLDARNAARLGLRPDVRRVPIFGLGCVAGAAGIARMHDYLRGAPHDVAALVSVEVCSLMYPAAEPTMATLVGSALFADGAAAVVAVGEHRGWQECMTGPDVLSTRSRMYPDSLDIMGWDIGGSGFRLVLSPDNLSSASVLHILRDARTKPPPAGTAGLLMAMGPGFCAELVLLRWH